MLAPADEDTPLPPYVVPAGRAVPVPLQRLGRPAAVRPGVRRPGAALAARRRVRRAARARAGRRRACRCWPAARPRARWWRPSTPRSPGPGRCRRCGGAAAAVPGEDHRPDRGVRGGPQGAGRAPRRRRGGDPQRGGGRPATPAPTPLPGYPRGRAARSASSAGSTSRARGCRCCSTALGRLAPDRPGLRLLVAGRGDAERPAAELPPALAGRVDLLGQVSEADKARMLRSVDVYVRAEHRRRELRDHPARGDGGRHPVVASDLDAFRRVLDGGRAGALFPTGDAGARWRARWPGCWTTRPAGRGWPTSAREVVAAYDWPVVAEQVVGCTRRSIAADPVRVSPDTSATPRSSSESDRTA